MSKIVRRADALARGLTDSELQRYCRTRAWRRLRPGRFVSREDFDALSPADRHRVIAEAVLDAATASDAVLSHITAAIFHNLDVGNVDLSRVHITRNRSGGSRSSRIRRVHTSPYTAHDVTSIDGTPVTALARTIADVARSLPFETAVCIADLAARTQGVTSEHVLAVLDSCPHHPDNRKARRVAEFMDGRSESVGESRTRIVLHQLGYTPELQVRIADDGGIFARIDFYLSEIITALEFDGRIKYGRLVPDGKVAADVLWEEKQREDRIRSGGLQVVRLTWADLDRPEVIERLIRAAADRAAKSAAPTVVIT